MQVEGGCHCGKVRYEAEVDPDKVVICHCTDCQSLSGSAFRTVVPTLQGAFSLLSGQLKIYTKIGESGNPRELAFCPECGTPIYSAPVADGSKIYALRVGSIRQRDELVPAVQYWVRSSQSWLGNLDAMEKLETQPTFGRNGEIDSGPGVQAR